MESKPGAAMAASGCAVPSSGSPTATPIRLSPKSKARTVRRFLARAWRSSASGMSRCVLQPRVVQAEKLHRLWQPLLRRDVEQDRVLRFDREPGVLSTLLLELPGRPAGVAHRHQHSVRNFVAADSFQDGL